MWQTVALWPPSEPGSSSVCGCVWGSPWCWRCFRLLSASACCPGRCTCPSGPRRRCTATTKRKKKGMNPVFTDLRKIQSDQILPAVHHHRLLFVLLSFGRLADEAEQRQSELRDAHVGPLGVMVLHDRPLVAPPLLGALWTKTGSDEKKHKHWECCSIK